jgi:glycosyltransferase involved in cell wall biosynthesis
VVLESLACGTPVVSVDVGAVREMITNDRVGCVVSTTADASALAAAVTKLRRIPAQRDAIRRHAAQFDWATVSRGQWQVFIEAVSPRASNERQGETR